MFGIISDNYKPEGFNTTFTKVESTISSLMQEINFSAPHFSNLQPKLMIDRKPLSMNPASAETTIKKRQNETELKCSITLSSMWFLDFNELPDKLQISGPDDPKLGSRSFIQEFSDHISNLQNPFVPKQKVNIENEIALRFFVRLREKPEMAKKAYKGLIAHELGHLHFNHCVEFMKFESTAKKIAMAAAVIFTVAAIVTLAVFAPYLVAAAVLIPLLIYAGYRISLLVKERLQENEADHYAATHFKDAGDGAEYGFTCAKLAIQDFRQSKTLSMSDRIASQLLFTGDEFIFTRFSHGSGTERIRRIKKACDSAFSEK